MKQSGQREGPSKANRERLIQGPSLQRPNNISLDPAAIKPPSLLSPEEYPPLPSNKKTPPSIIKHDDEGRSDQRRPNTTQMTVPVIKLNDKGLSDPPVGDQRHPDTIRRTAPASNAELELEVTSGRATAESRNWKPDVFAQNFIPKAFSDVNKAQAVQIWSEEARGVNYAAYISNFASPLFLPPREVPQAPPINGFPLVPLDYLDTQNYERHFNDSVLIDFRAQMMETQSYDLFAVKLKVLDHPMLQNFQLCVPGLHENTPRVVYGDNVILRQLVFEPGSTLPRGMTSWMNSGAFQRGRFSLSLYLSLWNIS